jgi:GNAT superfamily N-acetyltransferase
MPSIQTSASSHFSYTISPARTPADIEAIRGLLHIYNQTQIDELALEAEAASLPGRYSLPHGEMLLARLTPPAESKPIGWIGLRPFPELSEPRAQIRYTDVCEAKRLFILEEYRGLGIGRALVQAVVKAAKEKGFKEMRISVEKKLGWEIEMYKRWGFADIEKYFESVVPDLVYLALEIE